MNRWLEVLLAVVLVLAVGGGAFGATYYVATNGSNGNPGTISQPWATLSYAVSMVSAGDTINVRAGTYTQHLSWSSGADGAPGAYITIQAYDGDRSVSISGESGVGNTINLIGRQYVKIIGLEVTATQSGGYYCIKLEAGTQYVQVQRCYVHDSSAGDVVKLNQSDYLTIDGCEITRGGGSSPSGNNQCIDNVDVDYAVYRNNYMHDFPDMAYYAKGGSENVIIEGNVVGNGNQSYQGPVGGFGQETDQEFMDGAAYQSYNMVMRNNIFMNNPGGAVGTYSCYHGYFYNNLTYNCGTASSNLGIIWQRTTGDAWTPNTDGFYIFNNIFLDTRGQMPTVYRYHSGNYSGWQHDYNNFYNNGSAIPSAGMYDPNAEAHSTFGNPSLSLSGGTPTTWQGWVNYFRPLWNSQSNAMLRDKGVNAGGSPQPAVLKDIEGVVRPRDSGWDIGPYEYPGVPPVPDAEFVASPTAGSAPLAVSFTDASSGGPTSWSWNFGDSSTSTAQNPSHTYTNYGSYTVSLTAYNSAGNNTETKTNYITVTPLTAAFTSDKTWGEVPLAVQFTDQTDQSPTSWSWSFGDGGTSTTRNPSHTYNSAGYYTVALTAANVNGNNTCTKTNYITACSTVVVYPSAYGVEGSTTYVSGSISDLQTDNGVNMVFSRATGGSDFLASFDATTSYTPSQVHAVGYEAQLHASPANAVDGHLSGRYVSDPNNPWDWIDNTTIGGTDQWLYRTSTDVTRYLGATGAIGVALCGCRNSGYPSGAFSVYFDIVRFRLYLKPSGTPAPVANFTGNPTSGTAPLTVNFTDSSTNSPTSWSWTFGDSGTSTAQNPSHSYSSAGTYTVALTATNAGGSNTNTKNNYIIVNPPPPVANFTGTPTSGYTPLAVSFTDTSTGGPTSWSWSFGDSSTSTSQHPSHTYTSAGSYTVSLRATNAGGYDDEVKTSYITASTPPSAPVANFTGTPTSGQKPLAVSFTDTSTNSPTSWSWNFGDSSTSTSRNPSHTYTSAGTYTVSLRATNAGGYDDEVKTSYITVTNPPPVADFTATVTSGVAPLAVSFTDASTNTPTSWSWTFGDGGTSTAQNPSHTYTSAGYCTVALTATNAAGSNTNTKTNYVSVYTEAIIYPYAWESTHNIVTLQSGTLTDVQTDNSAYMVFRCNQSNFTYFVRYKWSPSYTPAQIYKLVVEYQWKNSFANQPTFCNSVKKSDGTFYETPWRLWTTTDQTWTWEATDPATYFYNNEIWVDLCGCNQNSTSYDVSVDMCRLKLWLIPSAPVANFTGTPTGGAAPLAVSFTDTSTNTPTSWSWTFGDGGTSTAQNPSHTYSTAGSYTVALTATNAYGNNTNTKNNYITVTVPAPVANFTGTPTSGTVPLAVNFTDTSTNTPTSWSWTFGDSNTSTAQNPSHTYSSAGTYTVALTATNAGGSNTNTKNNYVTVNPTPPVANFTGTPTSGYTPLAVSFTDTSPGGPTSWSWNFGDSSTSTSQHPSHTYTSAGTYTISLRATNAGGYDDEVKSGYITVSSGGVPVANFTANVTSGTKPLAVNFTDSSTNMPTSWSWTFGDATTATTQNPSHTYDAGGTYSVSLTATNASGSNTNTKTNYITVTSPQTTLVSDGFESVLSGSWVVTGTPDWFTGTPKNGTHSVQLLGASTAGIDEAIERLINTNGYTSIQVSFYLAGKSLDSTSEYVAASWYDGATWTELKRIKGGDSDADGTLRLYTYTLPTGAANNSSFKLRFALYSSATNDYGYVDDVAVKGVMNDYEVILYPSAWETHNNWGAQVTLTSGTLNDVQTDNDTGMVFACNATTYKSFVRFKWTPPYAASRLAKLTVEREWKGSRADTPTYDMSIKKSDGTFDEPMPFQLWTTTDKWFTWQTTSPATYYYNGEIWVDLCGCNQNSNSYTTTVDTMRLRLQLVHQ